MLDLIVLTCGALVQAPGQNRLNLKIDPILDSNSKEINLVIVRGRKEGGEDERPWKTLKGEVNRLRMREKLQKNAVIGKTQNCLEFKVNTLASCE